MTGLKMIYSNMVKPNFLIVGAPKSGTTSLYYYLKQHPDIYLPDKKELHYFTCELINRFQSGPGDADVVKGLCETKEDYYKHYSNVSNQPIVGEVSPSYLYFSEVASQIKKELGNVKILIMLRNPRDKAYSQYMHLIRDGRENLPFIDALLKENERKDKNWGDFWRYAESSLYSERVKTYIETFVAENVHVDFFEDFVDEPPIVLSRIYEFLKVDSSFKADTDRVYNKSGLSKLQFVTNLFSQKNAIKGFIRHLVPTKVRPIIRETILSYNTKNKPVIDSESAVFLDNYFSEDIKKLEVLLNRPINWLKNCE